MPCATPCKNCDRKGLPILFVRYAAAYSAQTKGMNALKPLQPMGQLQARPGGVSMQTALYNVRMLRAGYLYVRIERKGVPPNGRATSCIRTATWASFR
ncbi:toxin VasX [Variovorax sp. Varisp62]|uniref:toxin VasX n=1 Tax=Variovorax sp. Varisp62 TaxID=3243049 RepID=UPI0039B47BE9